MILVDSLPITRGILLLGAQVTGSIFASFLVKVLFPTPLNVRTTLAAGTSIAQGVFIEAILTAELVFTIFMLAKEKHKATFIAPVGIGLALFIAELVGVFYTGGSLNPARSLGPCVVTGTFDKEHWIYCKCSRYSSCLRPILTTILQGWDLPLELSLPSFFTSSLRCSSTRWQTPVKMAMTRITLPKTRITKLHKCMRQSTANDLSYFRCPTLLLRYRFFVPCYNTVSTLIIRWQVRAMQIHIVCIEQTE